MHRLGAWRMASYQLLVASRHEVCHGRCRASGDPQAVARRTRTDGWTDRDSSRWHCSSHRTVDDNRPGAGWTASCHPTVRTRDRRCRRPRPTARRPAIAVLSDGQGPGDPCRHQRRCRVRRVRHTRFIAGPKPQVDERVCGRNAAGGQVKIEVETSYIELRSDARRCTS